MSVLDHAKELADLVKKVGDIDLYKKIVELQGEVVQLSARNFELERKCVELQARLDERQATKHERSLLWRDGDMIPFCPLCAESNAKFIHLFSESMSDPTIKRWSCSICHHEFTGKDGSAFKARMPRFQN